MSERSEYLAAYLEEFEEVLQTLDAGMLNLEQNGVHPEPIQSMLRAAHRLKGASATLGFESVQQRTHQIENDLDRVRQGTIQADAPFVSMMFQCIDALREMKRLIRAGTWYPFTANPLDKDTDDVDVGLVKPTVLHPEISSKVQIDVERLDFVLAGIEKVQRQLQQLIDCLPFTEMIQNVQQQIDELQTVLMASRKVSIRPWFQIFPRMVRDLAYRAGKQVKFVMDIADMQINRELVGPMNDSLIQLLRNAVDHGIESEDEREKAGKSARGNILLKVEEKDGQTMITVTDDGRGIPIELLRAAALQQGVVRADEAHRLTDREAISLIFVAGISTATTVTEISGRGIGLDIVRETMDKLNATIDLQTVPGIGTTFIVNVPMNS